jgi:hypothetical protein
VTKPRGVDREFYDEMKARAERAESELAQYRARYGVLVDQVVAIKRHEMGMHPANFNPEDLDPMKALGTKTQAAIEEFCYGDPELRNYLRNWALSEIQKRHDVDPDERDETLANAIATGEAA